MNRSCGSSEGQERGVFVVDRPRPEVARVEMRNKIRVRRKGRKRGESDSMAILYETVGYLYQKSIQPPTNASKYRS